MVSRFAGRRTGGQCAIVCYHFATELDSTGQDYNERRDCRAGGNPYILGRFNPREIGRHRPNQTPKPGLGVKDSLHDQPGRFSLRCMSRSPS